VKENEVAVGVSMVRLRLDGNPQSIRKLMRFLDILCFYQAGLLLWVYQKAKQTQKAAAEPFNERLKNSQFQELILMRVALAPVSTRRTSPTKQIDSKKRLHIVTDPRHKKCIVLSDRITCN
jgi:predicted transporter